MSDVQQPGASSTGTYIAVGAVAVAIAAGAWVSLEVGSRMEGVNPQLAWDAPETLGQLVRGALTWPLASTLIMAGIVLVVALLATLVAVLLGRSRAKRTRVDAAARRMGRGHDITGLSYKNAQQVAQRLGIEGPVGIPLGKTVEGGQPLYASYEDMITMIAGPRVGKSTSLVIPALLEAPGFALVTSNKRDVLDTTRLLRGERGRVWVFDPQGVAAEPATWYWNPLSYVTDDEKAAKLAEHFASGSRKPGARTDAYFDPAGQDLLAGMLLAAALDGREITDVYRWLADDGNREPATILRESTYPLVADAVLGVMGLEAKQRGGIYGTAMQMASSLKSSRIATWVTPGAGREEFRPHDAVRSTDTLYSLSKEGAGSAGPLVLALTAAVVEAAEEYAVTQPGGRLRVPIAGILDEAANVCRWASLPDLYSHFGSRGINLVTILQSWSQGVDVWSQSGMRKLWSASNVKIYAGGVDEVDFLKQLSDNVGDFRYEQRTVSRGRDGSANVSRSLSKERKLDVSDLAALPRGRAVVFGSGSVPTLMRTVPWMDGRHAEKVRESIARAEARP